MLKQDQLQEEAAKVRVTPEELVAAVAELQAHKEGQSGTIAIGDAVHELSLEDSPADLLRTIEAQRAQQVRTQTKRRKKRVAAAAAALSLMLVSAGIALRPHYAPITTIPTVSAVPAEMLSLSNVREEQQVYVDSVNLSQILGGTPASQIQVDTNNEDIRWGLIKHGSEVYLQAYTLKTMEKTLRSKPMVSSSFALVNSADHFGSATGLEDDQGTLNPMMKVTIPVLAFQSDGSVEQTPKHAQVTVSVVHTDSHLWDGFENRFAQDRFAK